MDSVRAILRLGEADCAEIRKLAAAETQTDGFIRLLAEHSDTVIPTEEVSDDFRTYMTELALYTLAEKKRRRRRKRRRPRKAER